VDKFKHGINVVVVHLLTQVFEQEILGGLFD
jgi:hypothetical protein